jgi:hypothetical protein
MRGTLLLVVLLNYNYKLSLKIPNTILFYFSKNKKGLPIFLLLLHSWEPTWQFYFILFLKKLILKNQTPLTVPCGPAT